jgi:pyruvate dehydrogenase E2 component (dihydrolipoamide acetyltransferase)
MHIPLTRIQKLIGQRMLESKLSKSCFSIESKADVTEMMALRPRLGKSLGVRVTSNSFLIRALAVATARHPLMMGIVHAANSTMTVRIPEAVNVGFPVHAPQGLVVPVIKNAEKRALADIAKLEKQLTEKARSNKLTLEEMQGQTIGLSNLGVYGIDSFCGIVSPVASAILAVGNVIKTAWPDDGRISVRRLMSLALTADRRVVYETYAAGFLNDIIKQLQDPQQLV